MISKVECVIVECDNCENVFTDYNDFSIFPDETSVNSALSDCDWYREGGKYYCPECCSIDDEDNMVIDLTRKGKFSKSTKNKES